MVQTKVKTEETIVLDEDDEFDPELIMKQFVKEGWIIKKGIPETKKVVTIYERESIVELYNQEVTRVGNDLNNIDEKHLFIAPNRRNSCFIDATFELLWNAVLPFVDFKDIDETENIYDDMLISSYKMYISDVNDVEERKKVVVEASKMIRDFIWSIPSVADDDYSPPQFPPGEQNCLRELSELFFNKLSLKLRAKLSGFPGSGAVCRAIVCSEEDSHSSMDLHDFPVILEIPNDQMRESISIEKKSFECEEELEKTFNSGFHQFVVSRELKARCRSFGSCSGTITSKNIIDAEDAPPFLFVGDPTLFMPKDTDRLEPNLYLPENIYICDSVKYILHGRVYASQRTGYHFFTVCYKTINNVKYLVRIDNLLPKIIIITSDMEKARKIIRRYPNTAYTCYKKADI